MRAAAVTIFLCGIIVTALILTGCSETSPQNDQVDAQTFANGYWDRITLKCDGAVYFSYEWTKTGWIWELKGATVWVRASQLTEAQRLNGFEWLGTTGVSASAQRLLQSNGKRSEWLDGGPQYGANLSKKNGNWHADGTMVLANANKMSCSEMNSRLQK